MNKSLFLCALLVVGFVSGEKHEVKFWKYRRRRGDNITLVYEGNECINLPSDWQKAAESAVINHQCIRVYKQPDCKGSPTYFNSAHWEYPSFGGLGVDGKIVSFKKCESNLQFTLDARPRYIAMARNMYAVDIYQSTDYRHEINVTSGACYTLPEKWRDHIDDIDISKSHCWVLHEEISCAGKRVYILPTSLYLDSLYKYEIWYLKSVKTCELQFQDECKPIPCPRYLQNSSLEYAFWKSFFSIYSTRYLKMFEERVKKSKDGFISWDFLFSSSTAASSRGDQYSDAFEILHLILITLFENQPGKLNFDKTNIGNLRGLAKLVFEERYDQVRKYTENLQDHNFVIMKYMEELWRIIDQYLSRVENVWNPKTKGTYEDTYYAYFSRSTLENGVKIKLAYVGNECVNVPFDWRGRIKSVDTHGHCIQVYTQLDCKGSPTYLHRGYTGLIVVSGFNLSERIVSFKKCEPNLQFTSNKRPRYAVSVHKGEDGILENYMINVSSGECHTLPEKWHDKIRSVVIPNFQCWVFYDNISCEGYDLYIHPNSNSVDYVNLNNLGFDKSIKSAKTCTLEFQNEFSEPYPKYLHTSSVEYLFWKYFFSVYSHSYRIDFERQVKKSNDGLISWDFLFPSTTSASSRGDQYTDAFENLYLLLFNLVEGQPGTLGFNTDNIDTLSDLARIILAERHEHSTRYTNHWPRHNGAVIEQMEQSWTEIDRLLGTISRIWNPEKENDICGLVEPRKNLLLTTPLVSEGKEAFYGEDPWHVAIYRGTNTKKNLICGATIISPSVLVSAAHCFFSESLEMALNDTSEYEIYVAKFSRTYSKKDGNGTYQKIHKIKELIFSPNGYNPSLTQMYGSDIILILLEEPLKYNNFVRPACIDWDGSVFRNSANNLGRVVGWGITTNGGIPDFRDASERLLEAELPYLSYSDCVGKVTHITNDKFCGGAFSGPSVEQGDSGGGFMIKSEGRYYLRGIVSTRDTAPNSSISTFTNVAFYTSWIQKYV